MASQEELDAVTVKEMRLHYEAVLDRQIEELSGLIRKGYHERHNAESYLKDTIGRTLTNMDNIRTFAGLPLLMKALHKS